MLRHWLALDIETIPEPSAEALLPEPSAPSNWKDAAKIAEAIEAKRAAQRERMGLDPWASRPVVIAVQADSDAIPRALVCPDDETLRVALRDVARLLRPAAGDLRTLVGFRARTFDWPHLTFHARRLDVLEWPRLDTRRYGNPDMLDLYDHLCDDETEHVISRALKSTCRVYGIDVPDEDIAGADVALRIAGGDWQSVVEHCVADVRRVVALGRRVRLLAPAAAGGGK